MTAKRSMKVLTKVFLVSALASVFLLPEAWAQRLRPESVPKYVDPLPLASYAMPKTSSSPNLDYYEIAARQTMQSVLSCSNLGTQAPGCGTTSFNQTTVWAFGPNTPSDPLHPLADFHYPALPIEATWGKPVRVKWINDLVNHATTPPTFIPHPLLTGDQLLEHWANPAGNCEHGGPTDCTGRYAGRYTGPVPIVVHLHGGANVESSSDGLPEAWYLPANSPASYYKRGSVWGQIPGAPEVDGQAVFEYPNKGAAALLVTHDHTLGITAHNVYMGLAGPYILRGGPQDVADATVLPAGKYEVPLVIQDRSFNADGSLFFASEGNMMVANGKTWPYLDVEPRRYRFRIAIGSDSRFFQLKFGNTGSKKLNFTQIGADQGFLPSPVVLSTIKLTPGERADVIVDFTEFAGKTILLQGDSPIMQIRVGRVVTSNLGNSDPLTILFPTFVPILGDATITRRVGIFDSLLGPVTASLAGVPLVWDAPTTETITCPGPCETNPAIERWDIYNTTNGGDAHPIHLHEVRFQVLGRIINGVYTPAEPGERGFKDTVLSRGGTITMVKVEFSKGGLFAWHCHMIEHEDDQMMRPMCVTDPNHRSCNVN